MEELNSLSDDVEGIVIGNECMQSDSVISFSRFKNIAMIEIGYDSLSKATSIGLSSMVIANWLIWSHSSCYD